MKISKYAKAAVSALAAGAGSLSVAVTDDVISAAEGWTALVAVLVALGFTAGRRVTPPLRASREARLDATTLGAVLACVGVVSGSVVAYIGKRGETGLSRFNSVTDQVQEELIRKTAELAAVQAELDVLRKQRHDDLIRITHLEIEIIRLGGNPAP